MVYLYICRDCKNEFDVRAKIGTLNAEYINCPNCKSYSIYRKWTPIHVHFKGEGFTKNIKNYKNKE